MKILWDVSLNGGARESFLHFLIELRGVGGRGGDQSSNFGLLFADRGLLRVHLLAPIWKTFVSLRLLQNAATIVLITDGALLAYALK